MVPSISESVYFFRNCKPEFRSVSYLAPKMRKLLKFILFLILLSNVNSNKIDIIFQNPEDIILDVPLSITDFIDESFETFIRSGNLTSKEERKTKGTEKYAVNLKSILSVSFSVILTTVADGRSLHFGMYEDLKVVLEEFFTIESVQQVQIVDIRVRSNIKWFQK